MWCRLPRVKWTEIHYSRRKARVDEESVDRELRMSVDGSASTESCGKRVSMRASTVRGGSDPSSRVDVGLVVNTDIDQINAGPGIKQIKHRR